MPKYCLIFRAKKMLIEDAILAILGTKIQINNTFCDFFKLQKSVKLF